MVVQAAPPAVDVHECSMCLGEYDAAHPEFILHNEAGVDHVFHAACVNPWLEVNHNCPICRHVFEVLEVPALVGPLELPAPRVDDPEAAPVVEMVPLPAGDEPHECPICRDEFDADRPEFILHAAGRVNHVFHRDCVALWIRDHHSCPVCREEVRELPGAEGAQGPAQLLVEGMTPNVRFATLAIGQPLSQAVTAHLRDNHARYLEEVANMSFGIWAVNFLKLPYTIAVLALRTIWDGCAAVLFIVLDLLSAHCIETFKQQSKLMVYNFLVADLLSWLALVPSLFHPSAMTGANSLHLGMIPTIRV